MNYLKLQNEKLDVENINSLVTDESCGAISMFIGTTRDNFEDKKVISLEYEAYEPMAIKTMEKICSELRTKWTDLKHIAIYHRLGIVPVKESSIIIAISSPHRLSSLEALQYAINELKRTVPIWKKEKYENNSTNLNENPIKKRLKISKLNFNECLVDTLSNPLPKNFIQICANEDELSRRIQCFVERKREEIDENNVLDFTKNMNKNLNSNEEIKENEETCARVNSLIMRQDDSKSHLKVSRVKNEYGPQTMDDYTIALDKFTGTSKNIKIEENINDKGNLNIDIKPNISNGITERLENLENYLNLPQPISKDIYKRLKIIEDKIQFLETISPEYRHFVNDSRTSSEVDILQKKKYTIQDLDNYITIFKNKNGKKE